MTDFTFLLSHPGFRNGLLAQKLILVLVIGLVLCNSCANAQPGIENLRQGGGNYSQYLINKIISSTETVNGGSPILAFNNLPNTVGKRFLFDRWVTADSIIDNRQQIVAVDSLLFNFDKLTGTCLVSRDRVHIISVDRKAIRSFILVDNVGGRHHFRHEEIIDPAPFFEVLVDSKDRFILYKHHIADFDKANFRDDGVIQSGSKEDVYKDKSRYYLYHPQKKQFNIVELKRKKVALLPLLQSEEAAVDAFFRAHGGTTDENFLVQLIQSLN